MANIHDLSSLVTKASSFRAKAQELATNGSLEALDDETKSDIMTALSQAHVRLEVAERKFTELSIRVFGITYADIYNFPEKLNQLPGAYQTIYLTLASEYETCNEIKNAL